MKKELFNELAESLKEAVKIREGQLKASREIEYKPVDVKKIRSRLKVSQNQFSMMLGVRTATLQNWEQGRREPKGPAKVLLTLVEKNPEAILAALQA